MAKDNPKNIQKPLKQLIDDLDKVCEMNEEVGDTDVRDQMYDAVLHGFIKPRPKYKLPAKFGMFSDDGNKLVRAALQKFLEHPDVTAATSLQTAEARLAAFQNSDIESNDGNTYDEYFGYSEKP